MASEVLMPRLSDSMEEGTILRWLVAVGDPVARGQELVEVETDKATVVYEAEHDGTLVAVLAAEGASVPLGGPIALIGAEGEAAPEVSTAPAGPAASADAEPATASADSAPADAPTTSQAASARVAATPVARRLALELGVDLAALAGSGPRGRVVKRDVLAAEPAGTAGSSAAALPASPDPVPQARADGAKGAVERVSLTRTQQTVARRMAQSRATVPDFELTVEVDMRACAALRAQLKRAVDPAPSVNDMVVKAAATALRAFPRVNGTYADDHFELHERVNIGVAVAADDALVVPTIFDADARSLGAISHAARTLAGRVRDGSITPAELAGGTFTVSNLGMFGVDRFSAIVNAPQAAILAVGALRRRPLVQADDTIAVGETMQLTLACDHRILSGADGAHFLARVRELLEEPLALLL